MDCGVHAACGLSHGLHDLSCRSRVHALPDALSESVVMVGGFCMYGAVLDVVPCLFQSVHGIVGVGMDGDAFLQFLCEVAPVVVPVGFSGDSFPCCLFGHGEAVRGIVSIGSGAAFMVVCHVCPVAVGVVGVVPQGRAVFCHGRQSAYGIVGVGVGAAFPGEPPPLSGGR